MDRRSILIKIEKALATLGDVKADVLFESDDVVKIEIISDVFKDIILTKRIDMLSNTILDISTTDLIDYNISIIALTENEAKLSLKENVSNGEGFREVGQILMSQNDFEKIEAEIANPSKPNNYLKTAVKRHKQRNL